MKSYYVKFYKGSKPICGILIRGNSKDEAMLNAEFKLICKYPNVEYDYVSTEEE